MRADHPHTDPGDGRSECERCGKYVWPVTHSCKGVPVTEAARLRMAEPTQTCLVCNRMVTVVPSGRGFPPDVAKRKLEKICKAAGHVSRPQYRAGFSTGGFIQRPVEP